MLEKRIVALEVGSEYESAKRAVQNVEKQHLETLRTIRAAIVAEQAGGITSSSSSLSKDLESLKKENEELKRKNAKLEYRVKHMVSSMEELYERNQQ